MIAKIRIAKNRRRPICSRGIIAFMIDFRTTCKPGETQRERERPQRPVRRSPETLPTGCLLRRLRACGCGGQGKGEGRQMEDMQAAHFNERNNPSLYFKHFFLFVFLWPHHLVCRILVPWPGTEPGNMAVTLLSSNHWKFPIFDFKNNF